VTAFLFLLDRTAQEPPARLVALLRRFEEMEQTAAPSIAPDLEDLVRGAAHKQKAPPARMGGARNRRSGLFDLGYLEEQSGA
jgi:hypothetical protein